MRESVEIILSHLGSLLTVFGLLMVTPFFIAALWKEWYAAPGILAAAAITIVSDRLCVRAGGSRDPDEAHGIVTVAIGWLLVGIYGALLILFVALTAGLTTSWLSTPAMTITEDALPRSLQWWRSPMQWVGGVGVVVFAAAIAFTGGDEAFRTLYQEYGAVTSLRSDNRETIMLVWWIFCLLTFVAAVTFWLAGMPVWHAVNHAMTDVSTGGFVVTNEGIGAYNSVLIEAVVVPFMLLGAISFAVHHHLLQGDVELLWGDIQTRWLLGLTAAGTTAVAGLLLAVDSPLNAVRYGGFQLISALTCTGFETDTGIGHRWPVAGQIVVSSAMVIGGAAGSTAGGIKLVRAISLAKGSFYSVTGILEEEDERTLDVAQGEDVTAGQAAAEFDQAAAVGVL